MGEFGRGREVFEQASPSVGQGERARPQTYFVHSSENGAVVARLKLYTGQKSTSPVTALIKCLKVETAVDFR
jgi:hypothetical protein